MLNQDENLNPEILDRLIDGELSQHEYQHALQQLEVTPDGWRRCALSFLEQQALQIELRRLLQRDPIVTPRGSGNSKWNEDEPAELSDQFHFAPAGRDWDRWLGKPWIRWTSVLAVGIFAFITAIAIQSRNSDSTPIAKTSFFQPPTRELSPSPAPSFVADAQPSPVGERASISFQGTPQSFEVPVQQIALSQGRPTLAPDHIPPQIERLSSELGRRSRVERVVITLRTSGGEIVFLPFDRVILVDDFR